MLNPARERADGRGWWSRRHVPGKPGGEDEQTYLQAGSPCVADHPTQSSPWADPLDYMLLLGSLKDQEENLIVVIRGHRGERRKDRPKHQQLFPLQH